MSKRKQSPIGKYFQVKERRVPESQVKAGFTQASDPSAYHLVLINRAQWADPFGEVAIVIEPPLRGTFGKEYSFVPTLVCSIAPNGGIGEDVFSFDVEKTVYELPLGMIAPEYMDLRHRGLASGQFSDFKRRSLKIRGGRADNISPHYKLTCVMVEEEYGKLAQVVVPYTVSSFREGRWHDHNFKIYLRKLDCVKDHPLGLVLSRAFSHSYYSLNSCTIVDGQSCVDSFTRSVSSRYFFHREKGGNLVENEAMYAAYWAASMEPSYTDDDDGIAAPEPSLSTTTQLWKNVKVGTIGTLIGTGGDNASVFVVQDVTSSAVYAVMKDRSTGAVRQVDPPLPPPCQRHLASGPFTVPAVGTIRDSAMLLFGLYAQPRRGSLARLWDGTRSFVCEVVLMEGTDLWKLQRLGGGRFYYRRRHEFRLLCRRTSKAAGYVVCEWGNP